MKEAHLYGAKKPSLRSVTNQEEQMAFLRKLFQQPFSLQTEANAKVFPPSD